ncbi:MAG TPA: peptidoglycan-binding domain-containing protein [Luteimonas sp.]|nr:peptidoglycan-binding domain-containing protein [Luteimonas sp.]
MEVDARYYQHYENYVSDLVNGRLTIDPERQLSGIAPLPVFDDGTFRLGETNPRIREFQEVLISNGYRGARNAPLQPDGIYRLEMQPAVLAFQRDHGIAQTGDIDPATSHIALPLSRGLLIDRMDHVERVRMPFAPEPKRDGPVDDFRPGPSDYRRHPTQPEAAMRTERDSLTYSDPRHPDHALHEAIRRHLPVGTSDEMAAHITLQTKIGRVRDAEHLDVVMVHENRIFVMSKTPGFRAHVDLAETPPSINETMQRSDSLDAERAQQREQWMAQEQQLSQGRSLSRSLS